MKNETLSVCLQAHPNPLQDNHAYASVKYVPLVFGRHTILLFFGNDIHPNTNDN